MGLTIEAKGFYGIVPIRSSSGGIVTRYRRWREIPQWIRDYPSQTRINILEEPYYYIVSSELPGVALENLRVNIREGTLTIYTEITREGQKGEYRYSEELFGGIKGEVTLPEKAHILPEKVEFDRNVLLLIFSKATDEFLERRAFKRRNDMWAR